VLKAAADMLATGWWEVPIDMMQQVRSGQTCRMMSVKPGARSWVDEAIPFHESETGAEIARSVGASVVRGVPYLVDLRVRCPDGRVRSVSSIERPITEHGRVTRVIGTVQDIDDQVRQRKAMHEHVERRLDAEPLANMGHRARDFTANRAMSSEANLAEHRRSGLQRGSVPEARIRNG